MNTRSSTQLDPITVVASFSRDRIVDESLKLVRENQAGPAAFIASALATEKVRFKTITGSMITVDILLSATGEYGKVSTPPPVKRMPAALPEWTMVSTVLDEWDLSTLRQVPARLCLDVQGFVRDGQEFGRKRPWQPPQQISESVFCMKGTAEEIAQLPGRLVEQQKQRILVVTQGDKGVDLYHYGQLTHLLAAHLANLPDTIGAGDTFFGYFVAKMYEGLDPVTAANYAMSRTRDFLVAKRNVSNDVFEDVSCRI